MNGNKTFNAAIGLVILALVSACSDVKFSDAGSVAPSGIGGDGGGTRDPGSDPNDLSPITLCPFSKKRSHTGEKFTSIQISLSCSPIRNADL